MDYRKIYNQIIDKRRIEDYNGYTETHHIIPRSLGGTDDSVNLVKLSAREHYICHYLLMKIYKPGTASGNKMLKAFIMMIYCKSNNQCRYVSSRTYELLKHQFSKIQSELQSGEKNSQHGSMWISNIDLCETKKIKKTDIIPDGWIKKRIINFDEHTTSKNSNVNSKKLLKKIEKEKKQNQRINQHIEWYNLYNKVGFDEFVKITGYKYSKPNLVTAFSKLVPEFIPQNGKKRYSQVAQR